MNDSSDVLALLAAAVPVGPRDHELMTLHDLAGYVAIRFDMPEAEAGRTVVAALLGDDHWKDKAPESLPVYLRLKTGPRALCDQWTEWQGEKDPPPERWQSLRHLAHGVTFGCRTINEVPEGRNYDHHAGRFLAVVKADAWQAFGLNQPAAPSPVEQSRPPAPAVALKPTKKPGDDWTPADYAELLRQYESLTTGPNATKGESAREALGKAWSYAPNSIKPFLTTARKQRSATG